MQLPRNINKNALHKGGIAYIPVKVLRSVMSNNDLEKFTDYFFGKPVIVGIYNECGIPLKDIKIFYQIH